MRRPMPRHRRGLSLVEVMISTAIAAILLTAASAAYTASANAVDQNDQVFRAVQAMRVSILQMTTAIRQCQAVQVSGTSLDLIPFDSTLANPIQYTYQYASSTQQLQLVVTNGSSAPQTCVLANYVTGVVFAADTAPNPQTQVLDVMRVTVQVTTQIGPNAITVTGAACPRVNINY